METGFRCIPMKKVMGEGKRGAHWWKRMFDILALVWALIRGRAVIRAWALIRGNTVYNLMFEERGKAKLQEEGDEGNSDDVSIPFFYSRRLLFTDFSCFFFLLTFCKNSFNTVARTQRRMINVSSILGRCTTNNYYCILPCFRTLVLC